METGRVKRFGPGSLALWVWLVLSGCHLTWVMAMKPNGLAGRLGMTLGKPVMGWVFQRFLYNLRRYSDERFATARG